ncbi:hypothetical protein [Haloarcula salinisoli]|uniref:hypothetical protein n=1 Tax=Haloarcula salinisoli TaxID=2487746 RepID=UPI001F3E6DED|nr:hypothetical protein [Halomicroarcula salinisoli]
MRYRSSLVTDEWPRAGGLDWRARLDRFDSGRRPMSLHATTTVEASADVSLRVPRGGTEDLTSGVAGVLDAVDAVSAVTVERVTSVRPGNTDIRVDADVTVVLELPAAASGGATESARPLAVETQLTDGFGITQVNEVESVDPVGDA